MLRFKDYKPARNAKMSDQTFQMTKEDVKKQEARESRAHGGDVPAGSEASMKKVITTPKPLPTLTSH